MGDERPLVRQCLVLNTLAARPGGATVRKLAEEHGVGRKSIRRDLEVFRSGGFPLEETVLTCRSLRATEPVTCDAYPCGLVYHRGSLYLVGHAPRHGAIRHRKVKHRRRPARPTHLPRPGGFRPPRPPHRLLRRLPGAADVPTRICLSPCRPLHPAIPLPPRTSPPSKPAGSLLAEFHFSHTEAIKRWVLSFGGHAVVEEPEARRGEIVEELHALLHPIRPSASGHRESSMRGPSSRGRRHSLVSCSNTHSAVTIHFRVSVRRTKAGRGRARGPPSEALLLARLWRAPH